MIDHVPYEVKAAADSIDDDVLGVSYKVKKAEKVQEQEVKKQPQQKAPEPVEEFDEDSIPF
ncbi:hypothetical protein D3C86_1810870 [compost metagenome]